MPGRPARSNLPSQGIWRIVDDRIIAVDRAWAGPTTVLVPSEDVLTVVVDLPFATRAQRAANLGYALEDVVAEPLANLHFALGAEVTPRRHIAGVVRHDRMRVWIALLTEAGLEPAILTPDALALPTPPAGVWTVKAEGERALVRTDTGAGFALPLSAFDAAWEAAGKPRIATVGEPLPQALADGVEAETPLTDASGDPLLILSPLDLRQGAYAAIRPTATSALKTLALVAGLGVVAHLGLLGLDALLLDRMADKKEAEARSVLQTVAPQLSPDEDVIAAADRVLPSGGGGGGRPFTQLLARTSGGLPGAGAVVFNGATYAPGSLDLAVAASDQATLDRAVQALTASGLSATAAPAAAAPGATTGVAANLRVAEAAS